MTERSEIDKLKKIIWKSSLERKIERFRAVVSEGSNAEEYFGTEYLEKLTEKSNRLNTTILKLVGIYAVIMLALFVSQYLKGIELKVAGYNFKDVGYHKEVLLLLAAIISPMSALYSGYKRYIDSLIKVCIEMAVPDTKVREFYTHMWIDELGEVIGRKLIDEDDVFEHNFSLYVGRLFAVILVLSLVLLFLSGFFVQISVIYDVATNPSSTEYLNRFIVAISLLSIVVSWLIAIIQMPMPEVDYRNTAKLYEIKDIDPNEYDKIIKNIAEKNVKNERIYELIVPAFVYIVTFSIWVLLNSTAILSDLSEFVPRAVFGLVMVLPLTSEILSIIKRYVNKRFFKVYELRDESSIKAYRKVVFLMKAMRVLVPVILSVVYATSILQVWV